MVGPGSLGSWACPVLPCRWGGKERQAGGGPLGAQQDLELGPEELREGRADADGCGWAFERTHSQHGRDAPGGPQASGWGAEARVGSCQQGIVGSEKVWLELVSWEEVISSLLLDFIYLFL